MSAVSMVAEPQCPWMRRVPAGQVEGVLVDVVVWCERPPHDVGPHAMWDGKKYVPFKANEQRVVSPVTEWEVEAVR